MNKRVTLIIGVILIVAAILIPVLVTTASGGTPATVEWNGVNGAANNYDEGGTLHWNLTVGDADVESGYLYVEFADGTNDTFDGSVHGEGAMYFDSYGTSKVTYAKAYFYYSGVLRSPVLTISHGTPGTTTTTTEEEDTTTTEEETTTTTEEETTTTTEEETTTTTTEEETTTTTDPGTTTTTEPETTTTTYDVEFG